MSDELFDWVAVPHPDEDCKIIALVERKQTSCGPDGDFANGFCTIWSSGTPHSAAELARLFLAAPDMLAALRLFTSHSMSESRPSRGESFIGWQKGDGISAHERVKIARAALAKAGLS